MKNSSSAHTKRQDSQPLPNKNWVKSHKATLLLRTILIVLPVTMSCRLPPKTNSIYLCSILLHVGGVCGAGDPSANVLGSAPSQPRKCTPWT